MLELKLSSITLCDVRSEYHCQEFGLINVGSMIDGESGDYKIVLYVELRLTVELDEE